MNQQKISIRFYNDHEVRAVWSEETSRWYFSVLDVVGAINEQGDYTKTRNYWKYLKAKLKKENNELVSATTQLKLRASDGQSKRKAYTLFESGIIKSLSEGTVKSLQQIHAYIFGGLYDFAGIIRTKTISKGGFTFCLAQYLPLQMRQIVANSL